jgi:predicted GNAT family acetyltransferase
MKKSQQLNLLLGCVKDNIRNSGIDALMTVALFESAKKANLKVLDSHLIMEENTKMRALMERQDYTIYKRYRIFEKRV